MSTVTSKNELINFTAPDARVLVVDDNSMNLKVFGRLLKQTQIQVFTAESGFVCLEMVRSMHFDMIFMDHMMPEMDGIETFHRLREIEEAGDIPVIVLTANADENARDMYISEGFADYMLKPVKPETLIATIRSYIAPMLITDSETVSDVREMNYPDVEGIDWNVAASHFTDNDTMMETLENFYITLKRDAEKIDAFFRNIESDEGLLQYKIFVHSMKNSAALVGMTELSDKALRLEKAAGSGDREYIYAGHSEFTEEWIKYNDRLAGLFEKKSDGDAFNKKAFTAYLDRLAQAAEMLDMDVMDSETKALGEMNVPWEGGNERVKLLQAAVVDLDNLTIADMVEELKLKAEEWR